MKKKSIIFSDLTKKQLENLKELYIQKKVESMSHKELKQYVFEINILEIQSKYVDEKNVIETEIDSQKQRIELLERNSLDQEKKDMWDD